MLGVALKLLSLANAPQPHVVAGDVWLNPESHLYGITRFEHRIYESKSWFYHKTDFLLLIFVSVFLKK